jgi:hypothetical protein
LLISGLFHFEGWLVVHRAKNGIQQKEVNAGCAEETDPVGARPPKSCILTNVKSQYYDKRATRALLTT